MKDDSDRHCGELPEDELRRTRRQLMALSEKYSHLFDSAPIGYLTLSQTGKILDANRTAAVQLGIDRRWLLHTFLGNYVAAGERARLLALLLQAALSRQPQNCEIVLRAKTGSDFHARLESIPVADEEGEEVYLTSVMDISAQKQAEARFGESNSALEQEVQRRQNAEVALRTVEEKFRTIAENSPFGIVHFDAEGTILSCSNSLYRLTHLTPEQVEGMNAFTDLRDEGIKPHIARCLKGRLVHYEGYYHWSRTSLVTPMKVEFCPVFASDGTVAGCIGIYEDLSQYKEKQERIEASELELRQLSAKLLAAAEEERKRISGEMHDSIGSSLTAIKMILSKALFKAQQGRLNTEDLQKVITLTRTTTQEVRRIMSDLRPSVLDDFGIVVAIRWYCRQMQEALPNLQLKVYVDIDEEDVPEALEIVIFRIMQEALHNISKYSEAKTVEVHFGIVDDRIELRITDDGVGFDPETALDSDAPGGMGLIGMKERTRLSGGSFSVRSAVGAGTTIRTSWPLVRQDPQEK